MIRIAGLKKSFQDGDQRHDVLCGVDLDIAAGDFVALVGRSGSGKSTLLHCLAGIECADAGTIHIEEVEITSLDEAARTRLRRDRIGIVFQFFHLLPGLTVLENVELPAQLRGDRSTELRARAEALLEEVQLGERKLHFPDRLSGGEQQRVAIARALINDPALILADEPTGNLDAETADAILDLFRRIREKHGVTILMVTHSAAAAAVATRTARLVEGIIEGATPPQVIEGTDEGEGADEIAEAVDEAIDEPPEEGAGEEAEEAETPSTSDTPGGVRASARATELLNHAATGTEDATVPEDSEKDS